MDTKRYTVLRDAQLGYCTEGEIFQKEASAVQRVRLGPFSLAVERGSVRSHGMPLGYPSNPVMFLTHEIVWAVAALLVVIVLALRFVVLVNWSWTSTALIASTILVITVVGGHFVLLASAKKISTESSPDLRHHVAIYKLPFFSGRQGSIADSPGFARLYDASGSCHGEVKLYMIQNGQITWFRDSVEIGSVTVKLPK